MRILLVEDHPIFRFGVRHLLLQRWPEAQVQEAESLHKALSAIQSSAWDVAIVDLNLPDSVGIEAVTHIHRAASQMHILVLSLHEEAAYARQVLLQGAQGYLTKENAPDQLIVAIEQVLAGKRYISHELAQQLALGTLDKASPAALETLGPQEYRVMLQIIAGARVSEIAARMHLSPKTVSTYRSRLFEKLGVSSNVELVLYYQQHQPGSEPL
jgi:two-component system, NarL family, invasion response regulator UvrY